MTAEPSPIAEVVAIMDRASDVMVQARHDAVQRLTEIVRLRSALEWIREHSTDPDASDRAARALED
jgi:hypothetical protein